MKRPKHLKWYVILTVAFVAFGISGYVAYLLAYPKAEVSSAPRQTVESQVLTPTLLQEVRSWFGPWQLARPDSTGSPALVMFLQNGGVDVSSWQVGVDESWQADDPPQIVGFGQSGSNILVKINDGQIYTVAIAQPFVLEREPGRVYAVLSDGQGGYVVVSITSDQARELGQGR